LQRVLALTAAIWHNHHTGQPRLRSLITYDHWPLGINRLAALGGRWSKGAAMTTLSFDYDVAVVGAGPAGLVAALRAAELGRYTVVLQDGPLGGTCVHTGCVPTRVLAKTARLLRDLRGSGEYGIDTGPATVHWERLKAKVGRVIDQVLAAKAIPEQLDRAGVQLVTEGRAHFVGPHTLELAASGRQVSAETVIIAVGGHSRRLPLPGIEHTLVPEHLLDLAELPRSVAIVGSGNTGAQLVTVLRALGAEVTLLENQPRILPTADADVAAVLHRSFTDQGVHIITDIGGVYAVEPLPDGRRRLRYDRGGTDHALDVDQVVMSVGWPPALDGLGLETAGLTVEGGRISVDRYRRSRVPHILVAGDADGEAALVQAAVADGAVAAMTAALGPRAMACYDILPTGGFTDPDYGQVGLTEQQARAAVPGCLVATVPYGANERAIIDSRTTGLLKLISDPRRETVLGAHAVGEDALEVIQAIATAMAAGIDIVTLARVPFAYPTYTSIIATAATQLLGDSVPSSP
jgi:pyruvate/2-oxoglutarate dehydrogenase complex dihydrolipoamide dehydrogenase (E3) component